MSDPEPVAGSASVSGVPASWRRVYIGLGANLGDARATLAAVFEALERLPGCRAAGRSGIYLSAPVDAEGPDFFNAVVALDSGLSPLELLTALQDIELAHGRLRPYVNAPRTLDLDLLIHGDEVQVTPRLTLPHPRLHLRAFVLEPLSELAPDLQLPGLPPLDELRRACADQRIRRLPD